MLGAVALSLFTWRKTAPRDPRLITIYVAALAGAFLGAKIIYIISEGWLHWNEPNRWLHIATGKSILGALLGGYATVEFAKRLLRYPFVTGDWFATIVPLSIIIGRIGCLLHGCCLGIACRPAWYTLTDQHGEPRWPAVPLEIIFNLAAATALFTLRRKKILPGQHFHLYLMSYGLFRFAHEFARDTPAILGPFSGYAMTALAVFTLGFFGFLKRRKTLPLHIPPRRLVPAPGENRATPIGNFASPSSKSLH
jgi:phosphatidylglycerol---prolipoprotein diacylglyceryl transferase